MQPLRVHLTKVRICEIRMQIAASRTAGWQDHPDEMRFFQFLSLNFFYLQPFCTQIIVNFFPLPLLLFFVIVWFGWESSGFFIFIFLCTSVHIFLFLIKSGSKSWGRGGRGKGFWMGFRKGLGLGSDWFGLATCQVRVGAWVRSFCSV